MSEETEVYTIDELAEVFYPSYERAIDNEQERFREKVAEPLFEQCRATQKAVESMTHIRISQRTYHLYGDVEIRIDSRDYDCMNQADKQKIRQQTLDAGRNGHPTGAEADRYFKEAVAESRIHDGRSNFATEMQKVYQAIEDKWRREMTQAFEDEERHRKRLMKAEVLFDRYGNTQNNNA